MDRVLGCFSCICYLWKSYPSCGGQGRVDKGVWKCLQLICQSQCWTIPTQPPVLGKDFGDGDAMDPGSSFTQDSDLYMMEMVLLSLVDDLSL